MTAFSKSPLRSARRPLAAALTLAAAVALTACAGTPASGGSSSSAGASASTGTAHKALRIGFSPFTLQVPALKGLADGLTAVAGGQGDTVITADPKGDPSTQLQQIQQWVQLGQVDAIWVIPQAPNTITSVLKEAQAKGIVVIASAAASDFGFTGNQAGISFSNIDNAAYGKALGDLTTKCITDRLAGAAGIIYLRSASGAQSSDSTNSAFKAAVAAGAPKAKFANEQEAKDRLGSAQIVSSALQAAPDANTVVGTDDEASLGSLDAFNQAGKDPAKTCIIGAGGNDEAKQAVKDGKLFGVVAFDFQADLMQNIKELHTLAADPSAMGHQITTPINVITK